MGVFHATNLQLVAKSCHYALELYEQRVPYSRDVFGTGIAAHAVLEAVARCTNEMGRELTEEEVKVSALGVCERLMATGRSYDGHAEPAMKPDDVFAGQELALNWLLGVEPAQPGAMVEQGLGLDSDGQPCDYWKGENLSIRTILDSVRLVTESDEETSRKVLIVRDWKSAWSTDDGELETIQRKIQAIAAWRVFGPVDVLRLEVVNLRTQKVHPKELYREDGLEEAIAEWWRYVSTMVRALDAQKARGPRPASPGAGCVGCPYLQACHHAADYIERRGMHKTAEKRAVAYAVATAMREELAEELRVEVESGAIPVPGGEVGYSVKVKQTLREDAYLDLWTDWQDAGGEPEGFAKALALSKANAEKLSRVLFPERGQRKDRDEFVASMVEENRTKEFGIWPTKKTVDTAAQ